MDQPAAYFGLTNRSATACTLSGYPSLTLYDASGHLMSAVIRDGNAYQIPDDPGAHAVIVQPDQSVFFGFGWERQNPNGDANGCEYITRARVLLPDNNQWLTTATPLTDAPFCPQSGGSVTAIASRDAFKINPP
jgi:hypothetical protein